MRSARKLTPSGQRSHAILVTREEGGKRPGVLPAAKIEKKFSFPSFL
jgi:hypothetical protein